MIGAGLAGLAAVCECYPYNSQQALSAFQNQYAQSDAGIRNKDSNMTTRLDRRRKAIRAKWAARVKVVAGVMVALPVSVAVVAGLWRVALWTILT